MKAVRNKGGALKRFFGGVWRTIKKHKIISIILLLLALGGTVLLLLPRFARQNSRRATEAGYEFIRTVTLSRDDLSEVVSTTGIVDSGLTSTVTYSSTASDTCKTEYETAEKEYESAESSLEQLESKLKSAEKTKKQALESYEDACETEVSSDKLEDLYEQLDNCSLKAETAGKITSLNVNVGDTPNGTIAMIEDTESLIISITISEADINSVEIGMDCQISSDATDAEISGILTQIDPTTTQTGSFGAEVLVTTRDTGLKIGVNASVDIIISKTESSFTVPLDAIGNDGDGQGDYVYRSTGGSGTEMTFEKVYVTTGESNDYYIESTSDDLREGDVIRASSDLTQGLETVITEEEAESSAMGGLFGGLTGGGSSMPSGGGSSMPSGGGMGGMGPG